MSWQVKTICECVEQIATDTDLTMRKSFDAMLHWLAIQLRIESGVFVDKIKIRNLQCMQKNLKPSLFKKDPWDWLGEAAEELDIVKTALVSREQAHTIAEASLQGCYQTDRAKAILDPKAKTGRLILSAYDITQDKQHYYYGAEADAFLYHIALINKVIYDIPCKLLKANHEVHDINIDSQNWVHSNLWIPVPARRLKKPNKGEPTYVRA